MRFRISLVAPILILITSIAFAREPAQVILWPSEGTPILRFTFAKFQEIDSGAAGQLIYAIDTTAENLSAKLFAGQRFTVYLFDKKQVRIGSRWAWASISSHSARMDSKPAFFRLRSARVMCQVAASVTNWDPRNSTRLSYAMEVC
jgi:hypothetical protein